MSDTPIQSLSLPHWGRGPALRGPHGWGQRCRWMVRARFVVRLSSVIFVVLGSLLVPVPSGAEAALVGRVQETDPLGRPREAGTVKKPGSGKSSAPATELPPVGAEQELPPLPGPATGGVAGEAQAGGLRDFVPPTLPPSLLPRTRDFAAESGGPGRRTIQQFQDPGSAPQAEGIQTQAAEGTAVLAAHGGYQLVKRSAKVWEFGLEISSGNGPLRGALAAAPLPIDFPEQKVTVLSEFSSPTVGSVKMKDWPGQGRQMIVAVPQLAAGDTARATFIVRLERYDIIAPPQPLAWQFPDKGLREGRAYLGDSPYIETSHRRIKELAEQIVGEGGTPWEQVQAIYDWLQKNIEYEFDPVIHSCLVALDKQRGDCEEFASLFIALCRARGIPARAVWCNDHTYPEFLLVTPAGEAVWLPCQLTTHDHIFGQMFDDRPILQKGDKFTVVGDTQPGRYLKPAMKATAAAGTPQLKWIIRELNADDLPLQSSPLQSSPR